MKRTLLLLTMGALLTCPVLAQDDSTNTAPSGPPHHHGFLTQADFQELKAAHAAAIQANPDLATQGQALKAQAEAYRKALNAAMIAADPNVAPLLAKMEAMHKHHGPGGDGPPPGDDDSGQ